MHDKEALNEGIYETLLDEHLGGLLEQHPEMAATLGKIDDEAAPHAYSQFIQQVVQRSLRGMKPKDRLTLINRLIELLSAPDGLEYMKRKRLLDRPKQLLLALQAR